MNTDRSFASVLLAKVPYSWRIIDQISDLNPKYETFHELTAQKEDRLQQQSIIQHSQPQDSISGLMVNVNKDYHKYMYAGIDMDKIRRLQDYRRMAAFAEVADAIDEICDETIVRGDDENLPYDNVINFKLSGDHNKEVKKELIKEWDNYIVSYDLENKGWEQFRQFMIDGELFFENVISRNRPDYGVLGLVNIPPELINPIYDNVQNGVIKGYLLRRPQKDKRKEHKEKEEIILLDKNQICYIHSGIWNEDRSIRLPYIENARRAYKQLSLIEDSIVIYRLVRAPEKLVFYVDVGNMQPAKAENYLKRLMQQYWTKKSFDRSKKSVTNVYDPQSMLDSYWFARRTGDQGTKVETLAGGQNLGQLDDLMYFVKKLYKALKVPTARLDAADPFKDGSEITREELRFARFIMRLQGQFAAGVKESFMVHLKLRGLWEQYKLKTHHINIKFNVPTHFMLMRQNQLQDLRYNNFNNMSNNLSISHSYSQRYYLDWTDEQMAENREWLRKDAELFWEIEQIQTAGPDFREQQAEMGGAMGDLAAAGGGGMGGAPGALGGDMPPAFGPGPEVPGGEGAPAAPEGGAEAPPAA